MPTRISGTVKFAGLFLAECLFLWMFLSSDPLEQLAERDAFGQGPAVQEQAFAFAASWRHGMAGNSPLYLPGFFAMAVAAWIWSETGSAADRRRRAQRQGMLTLAAASAVAWATASMSAPFVVSAFAQASGFSTPSPIPMPRARALVAGAYTLITWSAFTIGSRMALTRRSLAPLAPVPFLTAGLIVMRPWTVDDFTATWFRRSLDGDPIAVGSLLAVPAVATLLASRITRITNDARNGSRGLRGYSS